jgi:cell division transport system permease protein
VVNNIYSGIVAGIIANIILWLMITYFNRGYVSIDPFVSATDLGIIFGIVIMLGVLITIVATTFAVNRYLKMQTDQLYYI